MRAGGRKRKKMLDWDEVDLHVGFTVTPIKRRKEVTLESFLQENAAARKKAKAARKVLQRKRMKKLAKKARKKQKNKNGNRVQVPKLKKPGPVVSVSDEEIMRYLREKEKLCQPCSVSHIRTQFRIGYKRGTHLVGRLNSERALARTDTVSLLEPGQTEAQHQNEPNEKDLLSAAS